MKNHYTNIMRINIFVVINQINKRKAKYIINACIPQSLYKNFHFFSSQSIRMNGNSINFDDKKKQQQKRRLQKQKIFLV